jgi:hypothetical protein
MPDEGLDSVLLKNLKAVQFGKDGGIEVPVRANGRDGIVFVVDAIAKAEHADADEPATPRKHTRSGWKRFFCR